MIEAIRDDVRKAAQIVSRHWPNFAEADDIEQDIVVKLLESPNAANKIVAADPGTRIAVLKTMGQQIASGYAVNYERFTGNFRYSTDDVRRILAVGLLLTSREDLADMGETLTEWMDLRESFEALAVSNPIQSDVLWRAYVDGEYDKTTSAARKLLSRAVTHLTDLMNQAHKRRRSDHQDGPGSRTSN